MRGHVPRRRNSSRLSAKFGDSTQYQLDFPAYVWDNGIKAGENDALTSPPPNRGKDGALPMTTSHLIPDRTTPVNPTPRRTYPQDWPSYNKAQTSEKDTLQILLAGLCSEIPQPPHVNGRPPLPLSDMVFASALKVYSGFSARRFNCDVGEARERGHIGTTVSKQQKWDTLGAERSGVGWRSGELPEGPVVASSPFGGLSLHLLPAL